MDSIDTDETIKLWPTTRGAVKLIDGLHTATGLPWWATLSLTALGVRAALFPFTLKQMHASSTLMSEWRLATRRAAMHHTKSQAIIPQSAQARAAASALSSQSPSGSLTIQGGAVLNDSLRSASVERDPAPQSCASNTCGASESTSSSRGDGDARHRQPKQSDPLNRAGMGERAAASNGDDAMHDEKMSNSSNSRNDEKQLLRGKPNMKSILEEYRRVRGESRAPHPAWLVGSPLIQISVFGTSVFAARHMAACNWPGFASGGALWFPDLTKAAAIIHWGQGIETTAVAFPYGQIGVVMPIAISLALFANINLGFAQPQAAVKAKGNGAVMAYVMGALRTVMEWATVPVLAVAMCLPHGALVYWLSSSTVSLAQSAILRWPAVRRVLQLPVQVSNVASSGQSWAAASTGSKPAAAQPGELSIDQLFLQAAEYKANDDTARSLDMITAIRAQHPQHARAHFAAGQLHAELQQWQLAEDAYVAAAGLEADLAQRARCLLGAGVAQHKQGDLEAALQAFTGASANALSAAGLSEAVSRHTARSGHCLSSSQSTTGEMSTAHGSYSPAAALSPANPVALVSGLREDSAEEAMSRMTSRGKPVQVVSHLDSARTSSVAEASSGSVSQAEKDASSGSGSVEASVLAERTAVRALMAQASVLKRLGRLQDAMDALSLAAVFDRGVEVHKQQLLAEIGPSASKRS